MFDWDLGIHPGRGFWYPREVDLGIQEREIWVSRGGRLADRDQCLTVIWISKGGGFVCPGWGFGYPG